MSDDVLQDMVGEWREDGTGKEQVDGTPTTCDSSFNRGYDAGYCAGMKDGAPPVRMPRWDQDKTAKVLGLVDDTRCGNCGEEVPAVRRRLVGEPATDKEQQR